MDETYGLKEISPTYLKSISQYPISRIIYDLLKDPLLVFNIKRLIGLIKQNPNITLFKGSPLSQYIIDPNASNVCIVYDLMQWGDDLMFRVIVSLTSHIYTINYREMIDINEVSGSFYNIELTTIGELINNMDLNRAINDIADRIRMYRDEYDNYLKNKTKNPEYVTIDFYDKIIVYVNKNDLFSLNNLYIRGEGILNDNYIQVGSRTYYELIIRIRQALSIPFIKNIFESILGTCNSYTYILPFENRNISYPLDFIKNAPIEEYIEYTST